MKITSIALVIKMQIKITRRHFILTESAKILYLEIGPSYFGNQKLWFSTIQNSRRNLEILLHTGTWRHARMYKAALFTIGK